MKSLAILLCTIILVSGLVIPASAETPEGGGGDNIPPVIEESSLLVQLIDDGVAWEWQDGSTSGNRAAPYIFDDETLHLELEVSDANGIDDLNAMEVKVTLGSTDSTIEFLCNLEFTTIDPENEISKGHYRGDLLIDSSIAQGKYDIAITATDPGAEQDAYDPQIYQDTVDILMKPALTLEIDKPSISFPSGGPGDVDLAANENPIGLRLQALIDDEHVPVVFSLSHFGTDMTSTSDDSTIPVDSITWSLGDQPGEATALGTELQTFADPLDEGESVLVYYWLNIPLPQATGDYQGQIEFDYVAD